MNSKRIRKKEGVLHVKLSSRSALGKAWKRKWVAVQQNTSSSGKSLLLELYVEKGAYDKTVTSLLLEGVVSVRRTRSKTQEHAIEISSASKVLLGVGAESETDAQEWLSMFRMNLLPPVKEMPCPPGISEDFVRVSVVPNKDSERSNVSGDYYAHISLTHINLYDTCTGKIDLDWDLRHLKKFMLISKCHQLDFEKIVHIMPSKRSVNGEGEFIFFSSKGKELVESLYERLSNAMTVKSRRSRSTSMLFEITAQELEQMFKDADQPPEKTLKEDEREEAEANGETVNRSVPEDVPVSNGEEPDGKDGAETPKEVVEPTPDEEQEDGVEVKKKQDEKQSDETQNQEEVAPEINEKKDVDNEVNNDEEPSSTIAHDTNLTDVAQQLERVSSQDEENLIERLAEDSQEDNKCNQTNPDEMDIGIQASAGPTEEQATPPDAVVDSDSKGPEELDVSLSQGNEQCAASDQQENTIDSGAGIEQSKELKDSTVQDGQSQLPANVHSVEETVTVVPTSENTQETVNQTQLTASVAIAQESAEPRDDETRLDEEKAEVQPVINVPDSKDQQELTEPATEHQQVVAEPVVTYVEAVVTEPVNADVELVTEVETERVATTEEHSDKAIQNITDVAEEQPSNEVADTEHGTKPEEHSNIELQEITVGNQEQSTPSVGESINTDSKPDPSTVTDKEHVATSEEKTSEATSEQTAKMIVREHETSTDDLPKENETDVAPTAVEDIAVVIPKVSETDALPLKSEGSVETEVEPSDTETSTKEVASESIPEVNSSSQTKSGMESSSEVPQKSSSEVPQKSSPEVEETKEDELNSNQNNSNTGSTGVRKISKTIPLPNSLTSRMASALRNAQKRKVSNTCSPCQETQTEFPSESRPTDDTPEIIV